MSWGNGPCLPAAIVGWGKKGRWGNEPPTNGRQQPWVKVSPCRGLGRERSAQVVPPTPQCHQTVPTNLSEEGGGGIGKRQRQRARCKQESECKVEEEGSEPPPPSPSHAREGVPPACLLEERSSANLEKKKGESTATNKRYDMRGEGRRAVELVWW